MGKSLLVSMEITTVGRAHDCRFNKKHRLKKGDPRLTIKEDGDELHYCLRCARSFLAKDVARIKELQERVEALWTAAKVENDVPTAGTVPANANGEKTRGRAAASR